MSQRLRLLLTFVLVSGGLVLIGALAVNAEKPSSPPDLVEEYIPIVQRQASAYVSELFILNTRFGKVRVIGVVQSLVDQPLYDVAVRVRGYDPKQQTFVTFTDTTILTATLPGQGNIFDLNTGFESLGLITAEVVDEQYTSSSVFAPVTVTNKETVSTAVGQFITVTLQNNQSHALNDIVGLFWHETEWFGHELQFIADHLGPGEIIVYSTFVYMSPWGEPKVIVQGSVEP